ncbi:hypothetical protein MJN52_23495, partial [Salmonella enterica subsp. enterica serovar Kentucky]|nr:hypothetical protein [Salmonella enterica subsp. enterica serovar Kentucky]
DWPGKQVTETLHPGKGDVVAMCTATLITTERKGGASVGAVAVKPEKRGRQLGRGKKEEGEEGKGKRGEGGRGREEKEERKREGTGRGKKEEKRKEGRSRGGGVRRRRGEEENKMAKGECSISANCW